MTISDIAKLAGVSSAAVSRYLNGGPLSEQKRAVIQAVVEKTGYSPDTAAQTLRTGKVRQVGVIVPSISSQSVGQITSGIAAELGARRYLMLLADTELDEQMELEYLTALQRNHVAGIILLGYDSSPQLCKALKDCRVPVVVTGQRFADLPCVYNDDRAAGRRVGQDVGLAGIGDNWAGKVVEPGLTTIRFYQRQVGQEAARMLLQSLEHTEPDAAPVRQTTLGYTLVERGSL